MAVSLPRRQTWAMVTRPRGLQSWKHRWTSAWRGARQPERDGGELRCRLLHGPSPRACGWELAGSPRAPRWVPGSGPSTLSLWVSEPAGHEAPGPCSACSLRLAQGFAYRLAEERKPGLLPCVQRPSGDAPLSSESVTQVLGASTALWCQELLLRFSSFSAEVLTLQRLDPTPKWKPP